MNCNPEEPAETISALLTDVGLTMPMAAFNGGGGVLPDLSVLDERLRPAYLLPAIVDLIPSHGLDVRLFCAGGWYELLASKRPVPQTAN